jgi:hypothetical protein
MKFSELPTGTVIKNKHGIFRKLPDSRKGAGRAEVVNHGTLPAGTIVVFHKTQIVELQK